MINRAGAAPFTADPSELVNGNVAALLGVSCTPMLGAFRRCVETGEPQRFRTALQGSRAAGTSDSTVTPMSEDRLLSIWCDITEHVVAQSVVEEALRYRSEAWQDLKDGLDSMPDAVVVVRLPPEGVDAASPREGAERAEVVFVNGVAASALVVSTLLQPSVQLSTLVGAEAAPWVADLVVRATLTSGDVSEQAVALDADGRVLAGRVVTVRSMTRGRVLIVSRDISEELWSVAGARSSDVDLRSENEPALRGLSKLRAARGGRSGAGGTPRRHWQKSVGRRVSRL